MSEPLASNECLLPRSSQEHSMSPTLYSETKPRFTTEQGLRQHGVYNSVVAAKIPLFISDKWVCWWVSGSCTIFSSFSLGATGSLTIMVAGSQGVSRGTEPSCPQGEPAHQFILGCLFSLPCLILSHCSLMLPELAFPKFKYLLPIPYLSICFRRNKLGTTLLSL